MSMLFGLSSSRRVASSSESTPGCQCHEAVPPLVVGPNVKAAAQVVDLHRSTGRNANDAPVLARPALVGDGMHNAWGTNRLCASKQIK